MSEIAVSYGPHPGVSDRLASAVRIFNYDPESGINDLAAHKPDDPSSPVPLNWQGNYGREAEGGDNIADPNDSSATGAAGDQAAFAGSELQS
jgi:hypothetical protein